MCDEGQKSVFYRANCTSDMQRCALCGQNVCWYHSAANNKGNVGGHSGCRDFCRTSNPQKCQGYMEVCTGCGQPYCARHIGGCQTCAGGRCARGCAVASCTETVVEPCLLCGQHVCLEHAVPDRNGAKGHAGCSGACETKVPEQCQGYMQRCPGCAGSFCKQHIQQAGAGRTAGGHVCKIHCQTNPLYRNNCAGEISRCPDCSFFFCEYHGEANESIMKMVGGHVCLGKSAGAYLAETFNILTTITSPADSSLHQGQVEKVFEGRVFRGGLRNACVVSFPGKYLQEWNTLVQSCKERALSSACVFLPKEDPQRRFGKHTQDPERPDRCYCHALYGGPRQWGCQWFEEWRKNVEDAIRLELTLVVVYFPGKVGEGIVKWADLAKEGDALWSRPGGLGGSQKGEVAYLMKNNWRFQGIDVNELREWVESSLRRTSASFIGNATSSFQSTDR